MWIVTGTLASRERSGYKKDSLMLSEMGRTGFLCHGFIPGRQRGIRWSENLAGRLAGDASGDISVAIDLDIDLAVVGGGKCFCVFP